MKNANPKINPITTIPGLLLVLVASIMFVALFFDLAVYESMKMYTACGLMAFGILLVISPDSIVTGINKAISKGLDKK